jgi:hypothetical protein
MAASIAAWWPCINEEDRKAIAYAGRNYGHREHILRKNYKSWREAANGAELTFVDLEVAIDALFKASSTYGAAALKLQACRTLAKP